jgi:hypothetical protein
LINYYDTSLNGNLIIGKDTTCDGNVNVIGNIYGTYYDSLSASVSSTTGIINIGSIGCGKDIIIGGSGTVSYPNTIMIGGTYDTTLQYGNYVILGSTVYASNKIQLLYDISGNNISHGGGLYIRDFNNDNAGYIAVSGNEEGWLLKGSANGTVIHFDCSNLQIPTNDLYTGHTINNGFMYIKNSTIDASYSIQTAPFDMSNIFFKDNTLSTSIKQYIISNIETSGNIVITNVSNATTTSSGSLNTSGGVGITKDVYIGGLLNMTGNSIIVNKPAINKYTNTILDVSGNAIITRLGLNTTAVNSNYTLEVIGDISQNGYIYQW